MVKKLLTALCVLAFAATALAATKGTNVTINGGKQTVAMQHSSNSHPATKRDPKLVTIYSNLGTGTDVYYESEGWTLSGSSSAVGEEVWIGTPFTPTANALVTEIETGIGYVEGTNQITISLDASSSGLPGKTLKSWSVTNMPTFGDCCTLNVSKDKKGIKVKKGTEYYVAATTTSSDADLWGAWNFNYAFTEGDFAYNINDAGWDTEDSYLGAVGVFGKK
jgi:hypothetical protein